MRWGELQKFIFAKKALRDLPKLFVQGEKNIKSWSQLKSTLMDEFGKRINSAELHSMLFKRKMKVEETVYEYFLKMKELANRGRIENDALFQYVINGIRDEQVNKIMLYGAKTMFEFKEKIEIYNKMRSNSRKNINHVDQRKVDITKPSTTKGQGGMFPPKRCFNCGRMGHLSVECNSREKGPKCFNCHQFGHKSFECKEPKQVTKQTREENARVHVTSSRRNICNDPLHKMIRINEIELHGLIDTGSDVNLMKASAYIEVGAPRLEKTFLELKGIGQEKVNTLGKFESTIEIDDIEILVEIHVMSDNHLPTSMIIGKSILNKVTLTVNSKEAKITMTIPNQDDEMTMRTYTTKNGTNREKIEEYQDTRSTFMLTVTENNDSELDIGKVEYKKIIENIDNHYSPRNIENSRVKVKLILTDEEPVFKPPKRLPKIECDEDKMCKKTKKKCKKTKKKCKKTKKCKKKKKYPKKQIHEGREENRRQCKKKKPASTYQIDDLVEMGRNQFAPCANICQKFIGPYKVRKKTRLRNWSSGTDDMQDGRMWDAKATTASRGIE